MKSNRFVKAKHLLLFAILVLMFCMNSPEKAMAWNNVDTNVFSIRLGTKPQRDKWASEKHPIYVDLNGGSKEKIYLRSNYNDDTSVYTLKIYINDKLALKYKGAYDASCVLTDLYSKDKYKEIVIEDSNGSPNPIRFYRYNGKKLVLKYQFKQSFHSVTASTIMNHQNVVYGKFGRCLGDGTFSTSEEHTGNYNNPVNNFGSACIEYKISGKKLSLASNTLDISTDGYPYENTSWGTVVAYKYPKLKSNPKVFTVKKNSKIYPIAWKIGTKYTYLKIKNTKKKVGWIIFKSKSVKFRAWVGM